jgi:hypothetical protein
MSAIVHRLRPSTPGDAMLHPAAIAAVAVLIANDHVLKDRWPGMVTGKLSDVAGLVFFPLLLLSLVEVAQALAGRLQPPSRRLLTTCILLTGSIFAAAELFPVWDHLLEVVFGWLRWPIGALEGVAGRPAVLTQDPADLFALPALLIAWVVGRRRMAPTLDAANRNI